jgi:hypothetical protein
MSYIKTIFLLFTIVLICCNNNNARPSNTANSFEKDSISINYGDKNEIQNILRKVLAWGNSAKSIDLLPAISDNHDSIYIGFDFEKHKQNLKILEATDLFSLSFIKNYDIIIRTINRKIKNNEYSTWFVGEFPPFDFTTDVNPWCQCQDIPNDIKDIWNQVVVTIIKLDSTSGELTWTWGNKVYPDIKSKFKVVKEQGKWKISYLQGFDFNESIK